jgi:hypothetical protein
MRFMIVVKATKDTEAGAMPEEKLMAAEDFAPGEAVERFREMGVASRK